MAYEIVDKFFVKPRGILAKKRGRQVLVNENGLVISEPIPREESMNLSCISDYKYEYRNYNEGDEITRFCNLTTFTEYIVKAQNCAPFAYVETNLNAPQCGYLEPLPTPAVPPNPFGTATYGLYRFYNDCDKDGRPYRVNIKKRAWVGDSQEIERGESSSLVVSYPSSEDKFTQIRSAEMILSFYSESDYDLEELYSDDERMFRVDAYYFDNNDPIFSGFLVPDSASEPFSHAPYAVTIRATDGLGALKDLPYPLPIGSKLDIRQSFKDILCYCLSGTSLNLDVQTIDNLYEIKMANGLNDDPLALATVNPIRLADNKGQIDSCYEVLENLCNQRGAYIAQVKGKWVFVRVNELSYTTIRRRTYSYTGLFLRGDYLNNLRIAGHEKEVQLINNGHNISIGNAYKRVLVFLEFGDVPSYVYNGDFEQWDGSNFNGWTKYGGLDFSRVQKSIKTTAGSSVLINDYAFQFNQEATNGKYIEAAPITVAGGDSVKLSFEFSLLTPFVKQGVDYAFFEVMIKVGRLYLANDGLNYKWISSLATATLDILSEGIVTLDMPECPDTGDMVIQFFGGAIYTPNRRSSFTGARPDRDIIGGTLPADDIKTTYIPIRIDNVRVNVKRKNINPIDGILNISENYASYYNSPDQINIKYGDYSPFKPSNFGNRSQRPTNSNGLIITDLYAIYTSDGSYSTAWTEFGQSGQPQPLGLFLAKSILKAYQRSFRYFSGDLLGDDLNYLNVFNIQKLPGKTFAFQGVDFDIKNKEARNVTLVQIFAKNFISNDISVPLAPGQDAPPITQNPNTPVPCVSDSVFQCPFNDVFGIPTITPSDYVQIELSFSLTNACAITPDTTYYSIEQPEVGVELFQDAGVTPAINGFYSDGDNSFTVVSGVITAVELC